MREGILFNGSAEKKENQLREKVLREVQKKFLK